MSCDHRVYAKIDLDAIRWNLLAMKEHIGENTKIMIIIKDDGYGHGALAIAKELSEYYDQIGVSNYHEAHALRKNHISKPILLLGYSYEKEYESILDDDITLTIFSLKAAKKLSQVAKKLNKNAKIHIKVDTGMGRVGFQLNDQSIEEVVSISRLPNIQIDGMFTHYAKADHEDKTFTQLQIKRFYNFMQTLEKNDINIPLLHTCNSAGIIDHQEVHFDMVRAGISLYGLYPSCEVNQLQVPLKPALSFISKVFYLKEVDAGTPISYGSTYITSKKSVIATIPVGYGDGYPRGLSSRGRVLINGQFAPIVGRVCMDQFMVDVTDIPDICEGDEVVLIGQQMNKTISVDEIANLMHTINYEIVCNINKRVPRIYYKDHKELYEINYFD